MIFMCNDKTVFECVDRGLFGSKRSVLLQAEKIDVKSRLFLFNVSTKAMMGPFRASAAAGINLVSDAWAAPGESSPFPVQVKVAPEGRDGAKHLPVARVRDLLCFANARNPNNFESVLDGKQATELGERLLRDGLRC
jgi:hypothetical protein